MPLFIYTKADTFAELLQKKAPHVERSFLGKHAPISLILFNIGLILFNTITEKKSNCSRRLLVTDPANGPFFKKTEKPFHRHYLSADDRRLFLSTVGSVRDRQHPIFFLSDGIYYFMNPKTVYSILN